MLTHSSIPRLVKIRSGTAPDFVTQGAYLAASCEPRGPSSPRRATQGQSNSLGEIKGAPNVAEIKKFDRGGLWGKLMLVRSIIPVVLYPRREDQIDD